MSRITKVLLSLAVAVTLSTPVMAESIVHVEDGGGILDIFDYEVRNDGDDIAIYLLANWQNTTDRNTSAGDNFYISLYQNGKELDGYFYSPYEPEGYDDRYTNLQPGYNTDCYFAYGLNDLSHVTFYLSCFASGEKYEFELDPADASTGDETPAEDAKDDEEQEETQGADEGEEYTIADLLARIEDLEARVEALENQ